MNQVDFANLLGVSTTTISRWENHHNVPNVREIERVDSVLATSGEPAAPAKARASGKTEPVVDPSFFDAVLLGLRKGHVSGREWIAVANELARVRGIDWHVELTEVARDE